MSAAVVLLVEVRYRAVYRCVECGMEQLGTVAMHDSDTFSAAQQAMRPVPAHMPVGWASYGRDIYRCPDHAI